MADGAQHRIRWGISPGRGRGVFAAEAIAAGAVIETAPVLEIPVAEVRNGDKLDSYLIEWREGPGEPCVLGFGYLSLYNHSASANVTLRRDFEAMTISVLALRDIAAGEELFYDYGIELWFEDAADVAAATP